MKTVNIACIGLGFGESFARIFAHHPSVGQVTVVDSYRPRLDDFLSSMNGKENVRAAGSFEEVLADPTIDAVCLFTGIPSHTSMTLAVLRAGKHCGCAVPMACSLEDLRLIVDTVRQTGMSYTMMETDIYGAHCMTAKDMLAKGEFGKIQFMRGVHYQPMDDGYWNTHLTHYWHGLPPMHYATHCIAPLWALAKSPIKKVYCVGSGTMSEELTAQYGNPFPIEDMLITFENGMKAEVVRGLFECSAIPSEGFNVYGSKKTLMAEYAWRRVEKVYAEGTHDNCRYDIDDSRFPNHYADLPEEIKRFTVWLTPEQAEHYRDFLDTAPLDNHYGSHPHLCHEFVSAILEGRKSVMNEEVAANICAAGICGHLSAMRDGEVIEIPKF